MEFHRYFPTQIAVPSRLNLDGDIIPMTIWILEVDQYFGSQIAVPSLGNLGGVDVKQELKAQ